MEKIKTLLAHRIFKILKWAFLILVGAFVVLVIVRAFHFYNLDKTNAEVAKIHATKLTLDDVMGKNLPPDPGAFADKTIAGIDANNNGIRDDVELAVFNTYPKSAKTRAVLLQYALALQMEVTQLILNKDTATAVAEEDSRAYNCIGKIVKKDSNDIQKIESYRNFIEAKQLNTEARKKEQKKFYDNIGSFELQSGCDIDLGLFSN
jgi:hypothetical protein